MNPENATEPTAYVDHFNHEGRSYRLFKRKKTKEAPWYLYFEHNHQRIPRCLETNIKEIAIARARPIISAVKGQKWKELAAAVAGTRIRQSDFSTLTEILAVAAQNPEGLESINKSISAFRCVFRAVHGADFEKLPASSINAALVSRYRKHLLGDKEDEDPSADITKRLEKRRKKITGASYLRQARSLFSTHMLEHYKNAGLKLPLATIDEFRKAQGFRHVIIEYHSPSDALLVQTFQQLDRLWHPGPGRIRAKRRAMYTALCLACGAGMRKSEIARAKWSWFQQRDGSVWVKSDALAKDGNPIDVPVVLDWWPRLQQIHAWQLAQGHSPEAYILPGTKTERSEEVFRHVSAWMRRLGWKTEKTIHEFRAWVGSKVAEKFGFHIASLFMRHKDEQTTRRYYGRYVKLKNIKLEGLAA